MYIIFQQQIKKKNAFNVTNKCYQLCENQKPFPVEFIRILLEKNSCKLDITFVLVNEMVTCKKIETSVKSKNVISIPSKFTNTDYW